MKNGLIIDKDGNKKWYLNNKLHRENNLPAIENKSGVKSWYLNGKSHRVDGPALKFAKGSYWYLHGFLLNEKQVKTFKEINSCPIVDLPLFMGDEFFAEVIENRFKKG